MSKQTTVSSQLGEGRRQCAVRIIYIPRVQRKGTLGLLGILGDCDLGIRAMMNSEILGLLRLIEKYSISDCDKRIEKHPRIHL